MPVQLQTPLAIVPKTSIQYSHRMAIELFFEVNETVALVCG